MAGTPALRARSASHFRRRHGSWVAAGAPAAGQVPLTGVARDVPGADAAGNGGRDPVISP